MTKKAIFVTGFEKFDKSNSNLSSEIVSNLDDEFQQFEVNFLTR